MRTPRKTLQSLILATDLSQRLRSALDFGAAIALLAILAALAANEVSGYISRAEVSEAMMLAPSVKGELITYRAQYGQWPQSSERLNVGALGNTYQLGRYVDSIELGAGGAVTAVFDNERPSDSIKDRRLTIRPLININDSSAPIAWVCGPHQFPAGFAPDGDDQTDIDPDYLPSICRKY